MAATLAAADLGMVEDRQPTEPMKTSAWTWTSSCPATWKTRSAACATASRCARCSGGAFVDAFCAVKELEYATYNRVISSWEREHLLLLV